MFENPRRGRQGRNFTTNVPKILVLKSSSEQIFSRKLPLGAPVHLRRSSEISPPLRSDQSKVCCLLDFSFLLKSKTFWESTSKNKGLREKGTCNTVCGRSKRAKGKAAWFFVCVDLCTVLNVAASRVTIMNKRNVKFIDLSPLTDFFLNHNWM